jgi:DNA-binding MarR family transcriptional regulator
MTTKPEDLRLQNLLGALSVAVGDGMDEAFDEACAVGDSAPAALILIHENPDTRIEGLARYLALSHSGTVRLVDRLEGRGWVARENCDDRRAVVLALTEDGERVATRLQKSRHGSLSRALSGIDAFDRQILERLVSRMLVNLVPDKAAADRTCRYCDGAACDQAGCPLDGCEA